MVQQEAINRQEISLLGRLVNSGMQSLDDLVEDGGVGSFKEIKINIICLPQTSGDSYKLDIVYFLVKHLNLVVSLEFRSSS